MKKKRLFDLKMALNQLSENTYTTKFSYFLAKNKRAIETEIAALQDSIKPSAAYTKYEQERIKIVESYAERQANGVFKISPTGEYVVSDDVREELNEKIEALKKKNKKAVDERQNQLEEFDEMIEKEDTDVEFKKIKFSELPPEMTSKHIEAIMELIIEEE